MGGEEARVLLQQTTTLGLCRDTTVGADSRAGPPDPHLLT